MLIVGLTGGIASGKTLACNYLEQLGASVIDADIIARKLLKQEANIAKIIAHFGKDIATPEGYINKNVFNKIVFNHLPNLRWLENLLHPQIKTAIKKAIVAINSNATNKTHHTQQSSYLVLAVPLLFEMGWNLMTDRTLAIVANVGLQKKRLLTRGLNANTAQTIINYQLPTDLYASYADDVVINKGSLADFYKQLQQIHQSYL